MIEDVAEWLKEELSVEVYVQELPKEVSTGISLVRTPGGDPPRGSYRVDELQVWVYGATLRDAEALYQRVAALLGRRFRRIVNDAGGVVISLDESGSPGSMLDDRVREPHIGNTWTMTVAR